MQQHCGRAGRRTEIVIKVGNLGRIPGMSRRRSWGLWNVGYPHTRDLTRAKDIGGLVERLREVRDPVDETSFSERALIATGLGLLEADAAVPALASLLQTSTRVDTRVCAAAALRQIGSPESARTLRKYLDDDTFAVKRSAIEVLSSFDSDIWPKLKEIAQSDPEPVIRGAAVEALGRMNEDSAVPFLVSIAERDRWSVAVSAVDALANLGSPASLDALWRLRSKGLWTAIRLNLPMKIAGARRLAAQRTGTGGGPTRR